MTKAIGYFKFYCKYHKYFMKNALLLSLLLITLGGCDTFSPRSKLNNKNGTIRDIEQNQNALKLELARVSNELGINNSKIGELQQGWANIKAHNNENTGIQILQGDGALILVFALITICMLFYYVFELEKYKKATSILSKEIIRSQDVQLRANVISASENTELEQFFRKMF